MRDVPGLESAGGCRHSTPHVSETGDRDLTLANPVDITALTAIVGGAVALSARNVHSLDVAYHPTQALESGANA